jgi:hypothetical protein
MREGFARREPSPIRGGMFGEPRAQSAFHERAVSDPRREGIFASPQFQRESPHSFRAFRPEQEPRIPINGAGALGRPSSQPMELAGPRTVDEIVGPRRDIPAEGRFGAFRNYGEPLGPQRRELTPRHEAHPFANGVTSQPREREIFGSPQVDRDGRPPPLRFHSGTFGAPMREESSGLFRPAIHPSADAARESIEARFDMRRDEPRSSPPLSDIGFARGRNGYIDRPLTFEEHQRMDASNREHHVRKESGDSGPRSIPPGISPELNRRGRNSPLPQAVQGAQPRHIGPGGDNPGIKMEFGRMFSGLGSGVGSATPTAERMANGATTPSRMTPTRHIEDGDLVRTAVGNIEDAKAASQAKGGRKTGRRSRDEERPEGDGRGTPDSQRGSKRLKTTGVQHHHHVKHHHHHHTHNAAMEPRSGSFGMMRLPSNPVPLHPPSAGHHHHHHHATHAHPGHHHHHHAPVRMTPAAHKPAVIVKTEKLLERISSKPRKHLGSHLYQTVVSEPSNTEAPLDSKIKYNSSMKALPPFHGKENCTFTVRVPRYYLRYTDKITETAEATPLEEVCKGRPVWGTEVYTDDSDVIAAAVHSGWLKGDFGWLKAENEAFRNLYDQEFEDEEEPADPLLTLNTRPMRPVKAPPDHDMHVTILILPALEEYVSSTQNHLHSREWDKTHDGMSYIIHKLAFVDEGTSTRYSDRGIAAKKQRMALEEAKRREAAAGLLMFANGGGGNHTVRVGA